MGHMVTRRTERGRNKLHPSFIEKRGLTGLFLIQKNRKGVHKMDKDKLVLADGTEITLEGSQGIGVLLFSAESRGVAGSIWEQMTPDNLKTISIKNVAGETTGSYENMILDHVLGKDSEDGTALLTVYLREKSNEEVLQDRISALEAELEALKAGQETQNEAIGDLGQTVSDMTQGGEE